MMKVSPQMQGEGTRGYRISQIFQRGKASPFDPRCHCVDVAGSVWWGIRARQLVTFFPYLWRHLPRAVPKAQRRHRGEKLDLCISLYFLKRNPIFVFRKCVRVLFSELLFSCLLYTSPSPRDRTRSRMPSSA